VPDGAAWCSDPSVELTGPVDGPIDEEVQIDGYASGDHSWRKLQSVSITSEFDRPDRRLGTVIAVHGG
jgi:hypothetical protein